VKIEISHSFEILIQFIPSTLVLNEFNYLNMILLSLFNVSNMFHDSFLTNI